MTSAPVGYKEDHRGNRLEDWRIERTDSLWTLSLRGAAEIAEHVVGALPRATLVRPSHPDPYWTHRIRMDFHPPEELHDFLELLKKALVLRVRKKEYVNGAIALNFHMCEKRDGSLHRTVSGELINSVKYGEGPPERMAAKHDQLQDRLGLVVRRHLWYSRATRVIPVPGSNPSVTSASIRIGTELARRFELPIVHVTTVRRPNRPVKDLTPAERKLMPSWYRIEEDLSNQTVLVVDDLYHTGITMAGVARAAVYAGAKAVLGLVATRNLRT